MTHNKKSESQLLFNKLEGGAMSKVKMKKILIAGLSSVALYISSIVLASEYDVRDLNLHDYAYPGSQIVTETKEQYAAKLLMYSHDPVDQVEKFYAKKDVKSKMVHRDPGRLVLEKTLAPNVPLKVVISWKPTRNRLNDSDLYRNLELAAALENHDQAELEVLRQRFDRLKDLFYPGDARSILKKCRQSGPGASAEKEMSMEERGRQMQELAMQGRLDELREMAETFSSKQKGAASGDAKGQWDKELLCLKELEKKMTFSVEIEVTASRD